MIIKPISDNNNYSNYYLDNGIEIVNVEDKEASNSTITVSVNVGQLQDPEDVPGLAHFLEHMLFMGSEKYPEENYFSNFIQKNNGYNNAFTSNENTTYFFTIDTSVFEQALDALSQFFKSPLISKESLSKEIDAVNSEHIKNIPNDFRRFYQVFKAVSNENSEMRKYGCGTKESLSKKFTSESGEIDYDKMREELINFYNRYYTTENIKIVTVSNLNTETQKKIIKENFNSIQKKEKYVIPKYKQFFSVSNPNCFNQIHIKSFDDIEQLMLIWHFPTDLVKNKFYKFFILDLFGDEVDKSLTLELYNAGLIIDLQSMNIYNDEYTDTMVVRMNLTDKGLKNYELVIKSVFDYLNTLKEMSFEQFTRLFSDYIQNEKLSFDYRTKIKDDSLALTIIDNLFKEDTKYCIGGLIKDTNVNDEAYKQTKNLLNSLNKNNCMVFLSHKQVEPELEEEWLKVGYSVFENTTLDSITSNFEFDLPEENPYTTYNDTIYKDNSNNLEKIDSNCYLRVTNFGNPKGLINSIFFTNSKTIEEITLLNMFLECKGEIIQKRFYNAIKAGYYPTLDLFGSASISQSYFSFSTSGYSEKIQVLHNEIVNFIFDTTEEIPDKFFKAVKYAKLKNIENSKMDQPIDLIFRILKNTTSSINFLPEQYKHIVENATIDKLIDNFNKLKFNQKDIYIGNFDRKNLERCKIIGTDNIQPVDYELKDLILKNEYVNNLKTKDIQEDGLMYFYDIGPINKDSYLDIFPYMKLLNTAVSDSFFENIRTKNKVGYSVFNNIFMTGSIYQMRIVWGFIAQSGVKTVDEMETLFNEYFSELRNIIINSNENFEISKQNIINNLSQKETSNSEFMSQDMNIVLGLRPDDYKKKLVEELKTISFDNMLEFFDSFITENSLKKIKIQKNS